MVPNAGLSASADDTGWEPMSSLTESGTAAPTTGTEWAWAVTALRLSLAVVFLWFGLIKIWPASPADPLVERTVFFLPHHMFFPTLGLWEAIVGVLFLHRRTTVLAVPLLAFQMLGTQLALVFAPTWTWVNPPFVPSDVGVYVLKNWILLAAAIVVASASDPIRYETLLRRVHQTTDHVGRLLSRRPGGSLEWCRVDELRFLRFSLAFALVWFGSLTAFGMGSAAGLIPDALAMLGVPAHHVGVVVGYGLLQVVAGVALLLDRPALAAGPMTVVIAAAMLPVLLIPNATFLVYPLAPSFEGVYFIKDWVLFCGVLALAAGHPAHRGGFRDPRLATG